MPSTINNSRPVNLFGWTVGVVIALAIAFVAGVSAAPTPASAGSSTTCAR